MPRWLQDDPPAEADRSVLELLLELQETRLACVERVEALVSSETVPCLQDVRKTVTVFMRLKRLNAAAQRLRQQSKARRVQHHA